MKNKNMIRGLLPIAIAGAFGASQSFGADFYFGEDQDIQVQVNSQLSIGASWRTEDADAALIGSTNGGTGGSATTDDGNLNFDKGETFSQIIKGSHDIQITKGNFGAFTRFKYWQDFELEDGNRDHGNSGSGYESGAPLSDDGFSDNAKFSGISLLDAYVYGSFDVADMPLDVRLGRQVVSWGESTFIQGGMNSSNPFDVSALRRPGATLKEGILPVGMAYFNLGATENLSIEAFYQYEWAKTEIDGCGTLFGADFAASGCDYVTVGNSGPYDDATALATGFAAERQDDVEAKDGGQFGLAARYFAEELNNTEFGVYFMNIHSRVPLINGVRSSMPGTVVGTSTITTSPVGGPFVPSVAATGLEVLNPAYHIAFPEDQKFYGLSFATNAGGVALSGEVSYKPDTPIQINGNHVLAGVLTENTAATPFAQRVIDTESGGVVQGYDEFDVTQIQVTAIQFMDRVLGASRVTLIGEVGVVLVDGVEDSEFLYGRDTVYGLGVASDGGYVTDSAWGYRTKAVLDYSDVFAGVSLKPSVSFSHDVEGYSPAPGQQFNEDRQSLGLSLEAIYQQAYTATIAYKMFDGGDYNTSEDKDFVSLSLGVTY
ncbi:MAG: DUF1302 domain-containing protein [Bermanella sp.]